MSVVTASSDKKYGLKALDDDAPSAEPVSSQVPYGTPSLLVIAGSITNAGRDGSALSDPPTDTQSVPLEALDPDLAGEAAAPSASSNMTTGTPPTSAMLGPPALPAGSMLRLSPSG